MPWQFFFMCTHIQCMPPRFFFRFLTKTCFSSETESVSVLMFSESFFIFSLNTYLILTYLCMHKCMYVQKVFSILFFLFPPPFYISKYVKRERPPSRCPISILLSTKIFCLGIFSFFFSLYCEQKRVFLLDLPLRRVQNIKKTDDIQINHQAQAALIYTLILSPCVCVVMLQTKKQSYKKLEILVIFFYSLSFFRRSESAPSAQTQIIMENNDENTPAVFFFRYTIHRTATPFPSL